MTDRVTMDQVQGFYREPPEGYERVASLEMSQEPYEFYNVLVVKHDGELRWFFDSGCSCPIPFDWMEFTDGNANLDGLWSFLDKKLATGRYALSSADVVDLMRKVLEASS